MYKYLKMILCFIVMFMLVNIKVSAADLACVSNGSCIKVCSYTNTFKSGNVYPMTIYYYESTEEFVVTYISNDYKKGPSSASDIFSTSGSPNIYTQSSVKINANEITCPENAYYDYKGLAVELCFDNNGTWCATAHDDAGTKFGRANKDFESSKKTYDYTDKLGAAAESAINGLDYIGMNVPKDKYDPLGNAAEAAGFSKDAAFVQNALLEYNAELAAKENEVIKETEVLASNGQVAEKMVSGAKANAAYRQENVKKTIGEGVYKSLGIEKFEFCEEVGVLKTFKIIGYALYIIKIIVPLLLIIFGTIDLVKAIVAKDSNVSIKAFVMRIVIAVIIFLVPTILDLLISLVDEMSDIVNDRNFSACADCVLDPFGDCDVDWADKINDTSEND